MNAGEIQEQLIRDGLPVKPDSVRTFQDGRFTVNYSREMSADEKSLVDGVVARLNTYKAQLASYEAALSNGYTDTETGIKLKTTKHAQEMFTALVTMLQEGLSLGAIANETEIVIWDFNDESVTLSVLQIRQLLFRYGMHCKTFFDEYAP